MSFANKVVLVTGGSSGIGAATAVAFSKEGANVAIVGRNEEKLNKVIEKCTSAGNKALSIKADITNEGEVERIVKETIEAFGKIDVLVNNAGIFKGVKVLDSNILETYDDVMNTNIRAQIQMTNLAGPFLIESKGSIINISSVAPYIRPTTSHVVYSMSKAALNSFSRNAAWEFAPHGVRVNTVNPGPVETDILDNSGIKISFTDMFPEMPLKRTSEAEEIADLVLYIASDKARGITGSEFTADNGFLLRY